MYCIEILSSNGRNLSQNSNCYSKENPKKKFIFMPLIKKINK